MRWRKYRKAKRSAGALYLIACDVGEEGGRLIPAMFNDMVTRSRIRLTLKLQE